MKKIILFALVITIIMVSAACGSDVKNEAAPPEGMSSVLPDSGAQMNDGKQESKDEAMLPIDIAKSMIGCDISELYDVIGEPVSAEYAKSCMGSGDDGELKYDGFTVYTNRTESEEIIQNVE